MSEDAPTAIRALKEGDLETILAWRNHPEVRRFMYTQHQISIEEHTRWFAQASKDPKRHLLIFEVANTPMGFINISQVSRGGIAEWGFYTGPHAPRGTGRALGRAALRYAFQAAGLHKLCGQALAFNAKSIRFHLSLGFQREGVLRHQHFDGESYYDVVCFGQLASEWHQQN